MNPSCYIELLGTLRVRQAQRQITRFRSQKTGGLLAYLAYYAHQTHSREVLIDLLWPQLELAAGRNNLSTALSSLRNQLEPPGVPAGAVLVADRASVGINLLALTTDVSLFETHLRSADQARNEAERVRSLAGAVEAYRGELLPGFFEEWVASERRRLADTYLLAIRQLVRLLENRGKLDDALGYARQAARSDPLSEEAHRDLIRLYLATGQPSAAVRQYHELEGLLAKEFGQLPSAATCQLLQEFLSQDGGKARSDTEAAARLKQAQHSPDAPSARQMAPRLPPTAPRGTVTFLRADFEGSPLCKKRETSDYQALVETFYELLQRQSQHHGGYEVKEERDSFIFAFQSAGEALSCAVSVQKALDLQQGPQGRGSRNVRMAVHTGDRQSRKDDYQGLALHNASRILAAGHGGQILCSETTAALLRHDLEMGVDLIDLGIFQLREKDAPEHLFQVAYAGMLERRFPPLNTAIGYASTLPIQFTRFFGRASEMSRLQALLLLPQTRLVTLLGPGGYGKTRLAVETAVRLLEPFSGAVWFACLADITDARLIPSVLMEALQLSRAGHLDPMEQIVEALGRQPSLLILDNFEHLVEEGRQTLQTLLARVPSLACLVTSRRSLYLDGEEAHAFVVPPLSTPGRDLSPEVLGAYQSVQLFVDRAQTVKPDFQLTTRNAAAVAELCTRLEGIPLALELAAARALVVTPAQMLAQMERRFDFLATRRYNVEERHRSLRAALDWSYALLPAELQEFFVQLSVFRGGWTLEAAETICEQPLALDYLAQLRECSLVLSEPSGCNREMRYCMLETLREYAGEKLPVDKMEPLHRRHFYYFLALAESSGRDRYESEHDNLRVALAWSRRETAKAEKDRLAVEPGLRLAALLGNFWYHRGYLSEGREQLADSLACAGADRLTATWASVLIAAGLLAVAQSDYAEAGALFEEALAIRRALGEKRGIIEVLIYEGIVAAAQSYFSQAKARFEEGLAFYQEQGDRANIADALDKLTFVAFEQGYYEKARALAEQSMAIQQELGTVGALFWLGRLAAAEGDLARAKTLYEECLASIQEHGDTQILPDILHNLGNVAHYQGDRTTARKRYGESLEICREIGNHFWEAINLRDLGTLAFDQGDEQTARTLYIESLTIQRKLGDRLGVVETIEAMAELAAIGQETECAARLFGVAATVREQLGTPRQNDQHPLYDQRMARVQESMDKATFEAAWASGSRMTLEQAIEYVLKED